jgi:7-carboxy-7-deazaguanine synthase
MKLVELYTSIQGEGPNVGKPIQFVRFGGCNMRCPGWPCDTQHAIDPQYRDTWAKTTPEELSASIPAYPPHVCLTGGEPLIQPEREMSFFVNLLLKKRFKIDLFTNGSRPFPPWVFSSDVTVVMDWKLPGSGEATTGWDMKVANREALGKKDAVKFVCADEDDLDVAHRLYLDWRAKYGGAGIRHKVYVAAAWGRMTEERIVEFITNNQLNWYLNTQVHKYIWDPERTGV